jgi:HEAT repeat protein
MTMVTHPAPPGAEDRKSTMTEDLEFALLRLADEGRPVRATNLAPLSDVPRSQMEVFRASWARFSPERRLELIRELVEQAEANIRLNFYAILRELLTDVDAQVRKLAIEGLWEDNRSTLIAPLVNLVVHDPVPDVRAAAAISLGRFVLLGALGEIGDEPARRAEEALRTTWSRLREVTEVRRRALEGLAYIDAAEVRELIQAAYYDDDPLLRQSAVFAMGRSADRRWARHVLAELGSRDAAMRFEAAVAAGELALPASVTPLVRLLEDVDATVRSAAATALGQVGGPAARRALQIAAQGEDEVLAEAAETALEELGFSSGSQSGGIIDFQAGGGIAAEVDTDSEEAEDESHYDDVVFDYDEDEVDWLDDDTEDETLPEEDL